MVMEVVEVDGGNYESKEIGSTNAQDSIDLDLSDLSLPRVIISGSHVSEDADDRVPTFNKVTGQVTLELDEAFDEDITVTIKNEATGKEQDVLIKAGETQVVVNVETSRIDDDYKQGDSSEVITITKISNPNVQGVDKKAEITISDDNDWDTIHREFTMDGYNRSFRSI